MSPQAGAWLNADKEWIRLANWAYNQLLLSATHHSESEIVLCRYGTVIVRDTFVGSDVTAEVVALLQEDEPVTRAVTKWRSLCST